MIELLLGGVTAPPQQEFLQIINKPKTVQVKQVKKPELTVEQKIKQNYYKCNTDIEWIRADNAECLPKRTAPTRKAVTTTQNSSQSLNGYIPGQCTAWVALNRYVPAGWGDASNWKYAAQQQGWTVSSIPIAGAIAWRYGHVAYVVSVGNGEVTISEQNYDWNSSIRTITIPVDNYLYIYQ